MRRFALVVAMLAALCVTVNGVASAAPAHRTVPQYPAGYNGPRISDHPAGACAGRWNVWSDWVYYDPGTSLGDGSIKVATSQEWEGDSSNNYCGILRSIAAVEGKRDQLTSDLGEPLVQATTELFKTDGTYLGGGSFTWSSNIGYSSYSYQYSDDISVSCGTYLHSWGAFLEKYSQQFVDAEPDINGVLEYPDGEDPGTYGNTHDLCYT